MAPKSILIVLMGSIGDVVRGLALVAPIRAALPHTRITWLVEPVCEPIVREHPLIDEVLVFDRRSPLRGLVRLASEMRSRSFDVTLDLQRHFKSGFFSWLSRAGRRIGFNRKNSKEGNWLFQTESIAPAADDLPKLRHYQLFLAKLAIPFDEQMRFGIAEKALPDSARTLLGEVKGRFIVLVLGSSWKSKDWLIEGYQKLIARVLQNSAEQIVLCGDRSQMERAKEVVAQHGSERILNFVGRTSLIDLGYILKNAKACIGPDSGPAHIAAAVGTPHVTLFGPTSPQRVAPFGSEDFSLQAAIGCAPCYRKECPGLDRLCMRLVSPESVWERLQTALGARDRRGI